MFDRFSRAKGEFEKIIQQSKVEIDLSHAENTLHWLLVTRPGADEILKLAAYAHDVERALPDHLNKEDFTDYDEYKRLHAKRGGEIAKRVAIVCGYDEQEAVRLGSIIARAEFPSDDDDVQHVCDADSISFFDNNIESYVLKNGHKQAKVKMRFMYERASNEAKQIIDNIMIVKQIKF